MGEGSWARIKISEPGCEFIHAVFLNKKEMTVYIVASPCVCVICVCNGLYWSLHMHRDMSPGKLVAPY